MVLSYLLLFVAAIIGGTINSVAGGGSFFTFPALIFTGVPAIIANATSTVAIWPGSVASAGAYRREVMKQPRAIFLILISISLIGGALGAVLLLRTPQAFFVALVPYLLLLATLLFTFSPTITARLRKHSSGSIRRSVGNIIGVSIAQLIIATYGGYFGGGIGILMLGTLAMMGMENIHEMNAVKTVLASCINGVAVVIFIVDRAVTWPQAIVMIIGATIGGYGGAALARKIEQKWIRLFVIIVGFALTLYFFIHGA